MERSSKSSGTGAIANGDSTPSRGSSKNYALEFKYCPSCADPSA
ncbi:MAG: hypothetical protein ACFCA4_16005 [Cyanophyceae cyanobacterium]